MKFTTEFPYRSIYLQCYNIHIVEYLRIQVESGAGWDYRPHMPLMPLRCGMHVADIIVEPDTATVSIVP